MSPNIQPGQIDTLAGNGESGFSGDGRPAGEASLNEPKGVAYDQEGNLYIADSENHLIRCVDRQSGLIHTVAGSSTEDIPSNQVSNEPDPGHHVFGPHRST